MNYVGRFAPSPSGPLHAGSLVAALASYMDARAHGGKWLLRIEDVDASRTVPGADRVIMHQLRSLGLQWDGEVAWQSQRESHYRRAFDTLMQRGLVYGCACTRREIAESHTAVPARQGMAYSLLDGERPYGGTCRNGLPPGRTARAWRLRVPRGIVRFDDRWLGRQEQEVAAAVGDFVLKRADGMWAYQLAVVVDDAEQGVTDIVRGADLLTSTARQRVLAQLLGLDYPRVMHVPLVVDPVSGLKLSKQNHAAALDLSQPVQRLSQAWRMLGFAPFDAATPAAFLQQAAYRWYARFGMPDTAGKHTATPTAAS